MMGRRARHQGGWRGHSHAPPGGGASEIISAISTLSCCRRT